MAYRAAAIANELLDLAEVSGRELTQIEIQKLVYFAQGWHLALKGEPLIGELIEAWQYGPVVRTLYDAFKKYGSDPIFERAASWRVDENGKSRWDYPSIQSDSPTDDVYAKTIVKYVWSQYGSLEAFKLVEITHLPGSPWRNAVERKKDYISNEDIKAYFESLMAPE